MKKVLCPSCGAEVPVRSKISVYAVCEYCRSTLIRGDVDVRTIGKAAELPDDMTPFQIGSTGQFDGLGFTIIGRIKVGWQDGYWNEWFLLFSDGKQGWLAEAQGFYAISMTVEDGLHGNTKKVLAKYADDLEKSESGLARPALGASWTIAGKRLRVVDIKKAKCIGVEGELPHKIEAGEIYVSIDLLGSSGEYGNVENYSDRQLVTFGRYVDWEELKCQNLRMLEGW
jgi:Domain of unknown function (DUF4178)